MCTFRTSSSSARLSRAQLPAFAGSSVRDRKKKKGGGGGGSKGEGEGRKEGNVLFNDALDTFYFTVIWRQTILIVRKETRCRHIDGGEI